ncbi:tryptase [Culex quinquefasciatus]|uniref:Tryptase n=1 Tax=Culex quinquefasciatus TaxID=7176 RepID=B0XGL2_CULQU|nr:tryptase [Culex quinquefasciatus]|eukprot:XP_001868784.1 tryptase [Culex quinquefasciatus]
MLPPFNPHPANHLAYQLHAHFQPQEPQTTPIRAVPRSLIWLCSQKYPPCFKNSTPMTCNSSRMQNSFSTPRPVAPKPKKCGQRRAAIASRVHFIDEDEGIEQRLDGMANFGEFPWTVYVQERVANGSFAYKCGGALITSGAVITAGHCVANARSNPASFQIIAGDWDRRHTRERLPSQIRQIDRIVLHPNYYSGSLYNDVAILIFNHLLNESTANVANICLPSIGENFHGSNCLLSGWGATPRTPAQEEPIQRFVTMPLVDPRSCEVQLQQTNSLRGKRFRMHDSFECAGGVKGRDSCKGSGGSPLVCEKGGAYVLAGIMSWGVSCGEGVPAVFANVVYQAGWIRGVIDELEDNVVYFV